MKATVRHLLCAAGLLLGCAGHSHAGTIYHLTPLGYLPGGNGSQAIAINANGEVAGLSALATGQGCFTWTSSGGLQPVGVPSATIAYGINDAGEVVGQTSMQHAFAITSAGLQDLGTFGGVNSAANGINDAGQVVGYAGYSESTFYFYDPFLWTPSGGLQNLGTLPGYQSGLAYAINAGGEVVGYCYNGAQVGPYRAFLWSNETMSSLPSLPGGVSSDATAINASGIVVGYSATYIGDNVYQPEACLWTASGAVQNLGAQQGTFAEGVNDSDVVICDFAENESSGFIWTSRGGIQSITSLLDTSGNDWTHLYLAGINDDGQIVGYGHNPQGNEEAFLLNPVPEPTGFLLATLGALGLGYWRFKRRRTVLPRPLPA